MNLDKVFSKYGKKFVRIAKKKVKKNTKSGDLERSIKYKITNSGNRLEITALEYGIYLNDKSKWIDESYAETFNKSFVRDISNEVTNEIMKALSSLKDLNTEE